jgi:hypothetical protein
MHFHNVSCDAKTDWVKKTDAPLKFASHHETVNKKFAKARDSLRGEGMGRRITGSLSLRPAEDLRITSMKLDTTAGVPHWRWLRKQRALRGFIPIRAAVAMASQMLNIVICLYVYLATNDPMSLFLARVAFTEMKLLHGSDQ